MSKSSLRAMSFGLVAVGILGCCFIAISADTGKSFLLSLKSVGQNTRKTITREHPRRNDPVQITDLKLRDKEAQLNKEFEAEDDWLKELSFKLKNISNKNITYVVVELSFPDSKATGHLMVRDFRFGRRPGEPNPTSEPLLLEPEKTIHISLAEQYTGIKSFLERRQSIRTHKTLKIRPFAIYFEDGTQWSGGDFYRPDPSAPGRYFKISDSPGMFSKS